MSKNKVSLDYKVFEKYAEELQKLGGDLKEATTQVLQNTHDMVTADIDRAMKKHNKTGRTSRSILRHSTVQWEGEIASIDVGFDIANGGLPSVFLMYGTPRHAPGHPGTEADKELYDAIYGAKIKRRRREMTEAVMQRAIKKRLGG